MKLFFVGDLYFNPNKSNKKMSIGNDLLDIIKDSDLFCVNLEGVMTQESNARKYPNKKGPCIRQDEDRVWQFLKEVEAASDAEIVFTEANNHIMDFCCEGLQYTNRRLQQLSSRLHMIGAGKYEEAYAPFIFEQEGIRVGMISVAEAGFGVAKSEEDNYGYAWFLHENVTKNIADLRRKCNCVIVVSHAGLEEVDIPLPEIREVYKAYIDAGADFVIGHHPHVIQGKENYENGLIYYSLGNFMFDEDDGDGEYNGRSIGVMLSLGQDQMTEEIPILYQNGMVEYDSASEKIFSRVCTKLQDAGYMTQITEICEKYYLETYRGYYCNIHGSRHPIYNIVLAIKALFIKSSRFDENWLYHNLEIETHRWTVLRGLEQHRRKNSI